MQELLQIDFVFMLSIRVTFFESGNTKFSTTFYIEPIRLLLLLFQWLTHSHSLALTQTHTRNRVFCSAPTPTKAHAHQRTNWRFIFMCAWWYKPNVSIASMVVVRWKFIGSLSFNHPNVGRQIGVSVNPQMLWVSEWRRCVCVCLCVSKCVCARQQAIIF